MRAAWYERTGPAHEVLVVGDVPEFEPGPGEVRVRLHSAGINPRDLKRRAGLGDRVMTEPRVIPGDDGAGRIDQVGPKVSNSRVGERVWVYFANYGRPFGTSADYVVVPAEQAVRLPAAATFDHGACLGIPALTAHRCVFADGPVDGKTLLVTGGAGGVGHYAIEMAVHAGARVIATASSDAKQQSALDAGAAVVVDRRRDDAPAQILDAAGGPGIERIIEVDLAANLPVSVAVLAENATIATYSSHSDPTPSLPFYPLMRRGTTIQFVSVFSTPADQLRAAIDDITAYLEQDLLTHPVASRFSLESVAAAHDYVERGEARGRTVIDLT